MTYYEIRNREVTLDETTWKEYKFAAFENYTEAQKEFEKVQKTTNQLHYNDDENLNGIRFNTTEWELNKIETDENDNDAYYECLDIKRATKIHTSINDYLRNVIEEDTENFKKNYNETINEIRYKTNSDYLTIERR